MSPRDVVDFLMVLREDILTATTRDGTPLRDISDVRQWLFEITKDYSAMEGPKIHSC